ncbi:unnamed protein product [Rhizopus microsporus]
MEERRSLRKSFQEWLSTKRNSSTPQPPLNATATLEDEHQPEVVKPQKSHTLIMESVRIIHALNRSENALLESPTGSGKSLALLCAALAWRDNERKKLAEKDAQEREERAKAMLSAATEELENVSEKRARNEEIIRPEDLFKRFKCDDTSFDDFQPNQMFNGKKIAEISTPASPSDALSASEPALASAAPSEREKPTAFPKIPRIFVGSRTHKQLTQLVSELKRNTNYSPRMTVLGSREQLCIHPKVSKSNNKAEDCSNLLDKQACVFAHRTKKLINRIMTEPANRILDIEDMVSLGKGIGGCPYYGSRKMYEVAEVIFCPYNYILDPVIRQLMDINLEGSIIILDEAHNMEDAARSAGSFEIDEKALNTVKIELTQVIKGGFEVHSHKILEHLFDGLWEWITSSDNIYNKQDYERYICVWSGQKIIEKLKELSITAHIFQTQFIPAYKAVSAHAEAIRKEAEDRSIYDELDRDDPEVIVHRRRCLSNNSLTIVRGIFLVFGYLFKEDCDYAEDYRMALMKRVERGGQKLGRKKNNPGQENVWTYKLGFWCLNPGIIFQDMCATTKSVILTSGTLSPMDSFASELQTKFVSKLEANHVIDPSQVWVSCLPTGPSGTSLKGIYTNMESFRYQDDVGEAIWQIAEVVPFGILCFLPSYNALDKLMERWNATGMKKQIESKKLILCEPKGSDKKVFEKTINRFYDHINKAMCAATGDQDGAILFAVYRGKVSEGIDFTNEYCRAVVALGIPYPGIKDMEVQLKKEYNDRKRMKHKNADVLTGREWYSIQAYRAINQALGRCIRHRNDWGAIILLEDRFQTQENVKGLSKWIRSKLQVYDNFQEGISSLKSFVKHRLSIEEESIAREAMDTFAIEEATKGAIETPSVEETTKEAIPIPPTIETTAISSINMADAIEANETPQIDTPNDAKTVKVESINNTLTDNDMDAIMKDIDEDVNCSPPKEEQIIISNFFTKATTTVDTSKKPVLCKYCECTLMTGDVGHLKPVDNFHLNCVLSSNQNDTQMLEVNDPSNWKTTNICIDVSKLPNETQVYMNKADKLCYQKINCTCGHLVGIIICGATSSEKTSYVGKVFLWDDRVITQRERQKGFLTSVKKVIEDDEVTKDEPLFESNSMTDMFYNLP